MHKALDRLHSTLRTGEVDESGVMAASPVTQYTRHRTQGRIDAYQDG